MTPKIRLNMSESGCRKPGCPHRFTRPNRHHLRHEKSWINLWNRIGAPPYKGDLGRGRRMFLRLRERYHQFRPQDVVVICEWHHVEIHQIYKRALSEARSKFRKNQDRFTMEEALWTMRLCKRYCREWLEKKSNGLNPGKARKRGLWG